MAQLFNQLKLTTMKKKWFFAGAVLLMAAAAVTVHLTRERSVSFDLLSANVEALTQNEIQVLMPCYMDNGSGTLGWYQECYKKDSYSGYKDGYPCPTLPSYIRAGYEMTCMKEYEVYY